MSILLDHMTKLFEDCYDILVITDNGSAICQHGKFWLPAAVDEPETPTVVIIVNTYRPQCDMDIILRAH